MDGLPALYDPVKLQGQVFKKFYFKVGKLTLGSYPRQTAGASYIKPQIESQKYHTPITCCSSDISF